ncbi:MAG: hypothetical protein KGI73_01540 [Patescibacteria group bacterium]|nr:hypothetical protein [Patescibacteria group bacterium]
MGERHLAELPEHVQETELLKRYVTLLNAWWNALTRKFKFKRRPQDTEAMAREWVDHYAGTKDLPLVEKVTLAGKLASIIRSQAAKKAVHTRRRNKQTQGELDL